MTRLSLETARKTTHTGLQVSPRDNHKDDRSEFFRQAIPVFRGWTKTPMTAARGGVDGYVIVQRYNWNGSAWAATDDEPTLVYNDTNQSTPTAGYRCKYTLCEGYPTLLTIDSSPV